MAKKMCKPYKFGDRITNWDRFNLCPTCGSKASGNCRCQKADHFCPNGHTWHNHQGQVATGSGH